MKKDQPRSGLAVRLPNPKGWVPFVGQIQASKEKSWPNVGWLGCVAVSTVAAVPLKLAACNTLPGTTTGAPVRVFPKPVSSFKGLAMSNLYQLLSPCGRVQHAGAFELTKVQ